MMRRFISFGSAGFCSMFCLAAVARGQYQPPAGYELIPLVDSSDQPLAPDGLAVSPSGEMAVTNGNTVTLYNTWQNGRSVMYAPVSNSAWEYDTDPVFLNNSTILFGQNAVDPSNPNLAPNSLWEVNFATGTSTQITVNNSLPFVEGVTVLDSTHALVSGQNPNAPASTGALYLDTVDLTKTSGNVTPVITNVGSGYPGLPGITPGGNLVLLEADSSSGSSFAHVYTPQGLTLANNALDDGNGYGAYGIAFDSAGNAYITTGNTITMISGIDSAAPLSTVEFGSDDSYAQYLTSIAYTGGSFVAGQAGDTGALIVNDGDDGGAFAIVVPEPASIGLIGAVVMLLATRRRETRR